MNTAQSQRWLAEYVQTGSETAFQSLVECYLDLVYSAARRMVGGDSHRAEDVAQIVFAELARKARTLSAEPTLGGWLHRHTCYVASNIMRTERRRQAREKVAAEMNALDAPSGAHLAQLALILDEAINQLEAPDRHAILLRFFEQRDFRAVGEAVGIKEDAARMRVNRALDKLHILLREQGVVLPAAALGAVLAAEAVTAAPVGLAVSITGTALASAAGMTATPVTLLKVMSMTKLKIVAAGALAVVAVTTPLILQHQSETKLRDENRSLRQQVDDQLSQYRLSLLRLSLRSSRWIKATRKCSMPSC